MALLTVSRTPRWLQIIPVALAMWAGIAAVAYWSDWTIPEFLEGDPLEIYARAKLAGDHPGGWLLNGDSMEPLGAPGPADWSDYPVPDRLVFVFTGLLSHHMGLVAAVQMMSCIIVGLNAVSFFLCARWLRSRWEWAAGLAVVFAFCNYNLRWAITLSLGQTFLLPPLILLCARIARKCGNRAMTRKGLLLAGAMGGWLGLGNPYHAYFAGVVSGGAMMLALFRRIPLHRLIPLGVLLGAMCLVLFASHAAFILHQLHGGNDRSLVRTLGDMQTYALNPMDWIVPPNDHRLPALARLGLRYQEWRQGRGEFFYNYLGLLGLAGLLGLFAQAIRRTSHWQWYRLDAQLGMIWIILFGVVGGINYWLGLAGLELFRASTRIGIFAHLWIFFFLCSWLSRRTRSLPRLVSIALAVGLSFLACWEATLPLAKRNYRANNHRRWAKYQNLTDRLERELSPNGAVFQLPVLPFPEAGRHFNLPDYDHFLPYLTSNTLRFSYGTLRHDPKLRWAHYLSTLPAGEMIAALENAGFSALWIDERGYADSAHALLGDLRAAGTKEWAPGEGLPYLHLIPLHPVARPKAPDLHDPRLMDSWDGSIGVQKLPQLLALNNWYQPERGADATWRWAPREATSGIWYEGKPTTAVLRFRLDAPAGSIVAIFRDGVETWRGTPGSQRNELHLTLAAGLNSLVWRLQGPTFKPGGADPRQLGFMVENLSVSVP